MCIIVGRAFDLNGSPYFADVCAEIVAHCSLLTAHRSLLPRCSLRFPVGAGTFDLFETLLIPAELRELRLVVEPFMRIASRLSQLDRWLCDAIVGAPRPVPIEASENQDD